MIEQGPDCFLKGSCSGSIVYYEKATQFCKISTLFLSTVNTDKSKVEMLQNFVAFSEYTNFTILHILVSVNCLPSSQAKLGTTKREISQRYEVKANSQCCQNPYEISDKVEKILKGT